MTDKQTDRPQPEACDQQILRLLRERKDDHLSQRAANLIEWAMFVVGARPHPETEQGVREVLAKMEAEPFPHLGLDQR